MTNANSCDIDGCERAVTARGWCKAHWLRWKRLGDPLPSTPLRQVYSDPEARFAAHTERRGACLIWTGTTNGQYGILRIGAGKQVAHRYAWERARGPIPDGMDVDHAIHCSVLCCEISHLRIATVSGNASNRSGATASSKTGVRNVVATKGRYRVCLQREGKQYRFGTYDSIEEATEVAQRARAELFGEFAGRG